MSAQTVPDGDGARPAYALDVPEGWGTTLRVGTEQRWIEPHEPDPRNPGQYIRITAAAGRRDVEAYAREVMDFERRGGAEISDEGPTTACDGQSAYRWTARGATNNGGGRIEERSLATAVTGGVGLVRYVRQQDISARADALATLRTLCPAPSFPMPSVAGWTRSPASPVGIFRYTSPDGTSSLYGSYRRLAHDRFPNTFSSDGRATVVNRWNESCTSGELVRIDLDRGPTKIEEARGYLNGYSYLALYEYPAARGPDPSAERALTAICRSAVQAAGSP